jgi:hypothetical protein
MVSLFMKASWKEYFTSLKVCIHLDQDVELVTPLDSDSCPNQAWKLWRTTLFLDGIYEPYWCDFFFSNLYIFISLIIGIDRISTYIRKEIIGWISKWQIESKSYFDLRGTFQLIVSEKITFFFFFFFSRSNWE